LNAIILCAGEGVRMKPITDHIPKPLLPIVDRTLLDIHLAELQRYGIEMVGINLYHKSDTIKTYLRGRGDENMKVVTAIEPELLGTGGALRNFMQFSDTDTLVTSCDALGNWDIRDLVTFHKSHEACATLLLSHECTDRVVEIDSEFHIVNIGSKGDTDMFYDFTGTAIYSKEVFSCLPEKHAFSFIDLIKHLRKQGKEVYGYTSRMVWYNINTIDAYFKIHEDILCQHIVVKGIRSSGNIFVDPSSKVETTRLGGFIAIGAGCTIGNNVDMYNTIVFAGSKIEQGEYKNCIMSDAFCIKVSNKDG